jgi:3-deoxy-D-manno-octulosonate 8-phosphate phosphatase (KDO 8-P phosphatase)
MSEIKMVISDFDGIFTDNTIYIDEDGKISRKINFRDVMGISLLIKNGFEFGIISGEKNSAIELLKKTFNLKEVHQQIRNKINVLQEIMERNNLSKEEIIYIGDDVNDIDCLEYVDNKYTVSNGIDKIKQIKNIKITKLSGGNGAFREISDEIISSK